jgi:hypothetical protein
MPGKRSALLIATSDYEDPRLPRLSGPTRDAVELQRVLGDPAIGDFVVEVARNAHAHDLRKRLEAFFLESRARDDLLLVQFSCHGLKDDAGRLYFAAADTELARLYSTGIGDNWLQELIAESRSQRIVLILDCCFGGSFATKMARRAPGAENVGIRERFDGRGRVVLTASTATQYSFEAGVLDGMPEPSVFTKALVRGLESGDADRNGDGNISVDELYDYAVDQLLDSEARQTPTKAGYVEGDLFLARNVRPRPIVGEPPPISLLDEVHRGSPMARLGAVSELQRLAGSGDKAVVARAIEELQVLAHDDSKRVSDAAVAVLAELEQMALEQRRQRAQNGHEPHIIQPVQHQTLAADDERQRASRRRGVVAAAGGAGALTIAIVVLLAWSGFGPFKSAKVGGDDPTPSAAPTPSRIPTTGGLTITVPDVVGRSENDAVQALEAEGLMPRQGAAKPDDKWPKGIVTKTNPSANKPASRQQVVTYFVSTGPRPTPAPTPRPTQIAVPDLRGQTPGVAGRSIGDSDLKWGARVGWVTRRLIPAGHIAKTDPGTNDRVDPGTRINYFLSSGPGITPGPWPTPTPRRPPVPEPSSVAPRDVRVGD